MLQAYEIDNALKQAHPYKTWLKDNAIRIESKLHLEKADGVEALVGDALNTHQKLHRVTNE